MFYFLASFLKILEAYVNINYLVWKRKIENVKNNYANQKMTNASNAYSFSGRSYCKQKNFHARILLFWSMRSFSIILFVFIR